MIVDCTYLLILMLDNCLGCLTFCISIVLRSFWGFLPSIGFKKSGTLEELIPVVVLLSTPILKFARRDGSE